MEGGGDAKVFTLQAVSKHSNSDDCWLVIDGKMMVYKVVRPMIVPSVYDVTKFLDDHPGGGDVLLSATGKDATDDFEDVGHSSTARAMMDGYLVGEIDKSTIPAKPVYAAPPMHLSVNQEKKSEFIIKLLQFFIPLGILALAVAIRFYTKSS